jgi:sugar transferase (PEP-CTERM/EpsH1 system associated)
MRILHVLHSFDTGGLETVLAGLIDNMDRSRFSHSICVFSDRLKALEKIKSVPVEVHIVKRHFPNDPTVLPRLVRLMLKERPDVVRTYNWGGIEGIPAARAAGIRAVIHSEHGAELQEISKDLKRRIVTRRFLLKLCRNVISVSRYRRDWLIDTVGVDRQKVELIPNGCSLDRFCPGDDPGLREKLGIKSSDTVVGSVGTLKELKGYHLLLEAFAEVAARYNGLKLLIVGAGPERDRLIKLADDLDVRDIVFFPGEAADTAPFYKAMDVFVLSSLSENFPNVLLEAMATALPIVGTDVGDVRYMVDGDSGGVIAKPGDASSLEKGMEDILRDMSAARAKGCFARKRAEELFSFERMVGSYEKLLDLKR